MTSSIRIAQVFPELVGKKTRAVWKIYGEKLKYIINYALLLVHYNARRPMVTVLDKHVCKTKKKKMILAAH